MNSKSRYKTKQMEEVCLYLESMQGNHVTVADISNYFKTKNIPIGTTTIYRHLERLVGDGKVAKYVVDGTSSACFEYIGQHEEKKESSCYHCKCEECGKIIHLHCEEVMHLGNHIFEHHGFQLDYQRTIFYGICTDCGGKN